LKPHEQLAKLGSSGRPRWGVEMEVVDDCGHPVLSGQEGEIRVRGASVCQGYYRNQPEQEAAFRDGWYYTGDMGLIDDEGYLYVKGRLKDIIKTGSINVSPREIENNILTLAGVKDAVVVGVPDPEWGEAVKAIVALDGDVCLSENDIQQHCRKSLAGFKVPKFVDFTQIIERNELGKMTGAFKAAAIAGTIGTEHAASGDCLQ
jgi:acyl-CoA synthetase (AMP-forming)/AMP-acid ligase II